MGGLANFGQGFSNSIQDFLSKVSGGNSNQSPGADSPFGQRAGYGSGNLIEAIVAAKHPGVMAASNAFGSLIRGQGPSAPPVDISGGVKGQHGGQGILTKLIGGLLGGGGGTAAPAASAGAGSEAATAAASDAGGASLASEGGGSLASLFGL